MWPQLSGAKHWIDNHPVRAATFAGWLQQGVTGLSAILVIPILLTNLGAETTGVWLSFQGFVMLAGLADFGVGLAITRQVAHCLGADSESASTGDFLWFGRQWQGVWAIWKYSAIIYSVTILVAAAIGVAVFELFVVRSRIVEGWQENPRLLWYVMLLVPCLLVSAARSISLLNGAGKLLTTRLLAATYFGFQAAAVILFATFSQSLLLMAIASVGVTSIYCISLFGIARSILLAKQSGHECRWVFSAALLGKFTKIAVPLGFVNIGGFLTSSIQVPMIGAILGPAAVAPFFLAQKIGQFLVQAAIQFVAPKAIAFSTLIGRQQSSDATRSMDHVARFALFSIVFAQLVFVFCVTPIAPVLLSGKAYPDFAVIALMGFDFVLLGLSVVFSQFVMASGSNPFVYTTLLSGVLNILGIIVVTPVLGLIALPIVSLAAGLMTNYIYSLICWLKLRRSLV